MRMPSSLVAQNAISTVVGIAAATVVGADHQTAGAFLAFVIGTAGTRLALGMATDPRFRR